MVDYLNSTYDSLEGLSAFLHAQEMRRTPKQKLTFI